jgi:hypothetical protein
MGLLRLRPGEGGSGPLVGLESCMRTLALLRPNAFGLLQCGGFRR